jgi:hypothetical protein
MNKVEVRLIVQRERLSPLARFSTAVQFAYRNGFFTIPPFVARTIQ